MLVGDPSDDLVVVLFVVGEVGPPQFFAVFGIESGDLMLGIHRIDPAVGDHR